MADFQHGGNFQAGQAFQRKAHNLGLFGSANRTDALQAHLADLREGVAFPAGAADLLCIIILFAFPGGGLAFLAIESVTSGLMARSLPSRSVKVMTWESERKRSFC